MPFIPRSHIQQSGLFHVICRGNNHANLFKDSDDFCAFIDRTKRFKKEWPFEIYHYSLMPTHVHFEANVERLSYLSKAIQGIQLSYHSHYHKKYQYTGHLWHGRFRSIAIESELYVLRCGRYVEINPVFAGIVVHPEDYRWSSSKFYILGKKDPLIDVDPFYLGLGSNDLERQKIYGEFMRAGRNLGYDEESKLFE